MSREQKMNLYRILLAGVLLAVVWLLPVAGVWKSVLFLIPYLLCGYDVLLSALRGLFRGRMLGEHFLMAIASAGAFMLGDCPEAVAVMLFYQVGEWFQDFAVDKSRRDIAKLMDIRPDAATVIRGGEELTLPPEAVEVGETILIRPGERIALDGVIVDGATSVNVAALTGESLPVDKAPGERVLSGAINLTGMIRVRVESAFGESTVARILELVERASEKKARTERFITRFSRVYTPCVVGVALLLAIIPPLLFGAPWMDWVRRALIFLVVSCPCALVVSVPLTFFGGIGGASRTGVLIKGANDLEMLSKIKTCVFDKTGTLTRGSFIVTAIHPEAASEADLLDIAAVAEAHSSHPIAQSIVAAHGGDIDKSRVSGVRERPGLGVEAVIDGREIYVGNARLMEAVGVECGDCEREACRNGGATIHIAQAGAYLGHIVVSDEIKPDAKASLDALRALGVNRIALLTGDARETAEAVGEKLGLDEVCAELLPEGKVTAVESWLDAEAPLAFVGDGVNDAPVLARADLGVAMGALGSDAAIEAADVVLMDDNPMKLPQAMRGARRTMRIVRQNILLTLSVKAAVMLLGALGLADMWFAVFADVGVLVLAILNAMRALRGEKA